MSAFVGATGMKFGQTLKASPFASANRLPSLALEYKALKKVIKRDDDFLPQLAKWVEMLDAAFAAQARECLARAKPLLGTWLITRKSNKVRRVPPRAAQPRHFSGRSSSTQYAVHVRSRCVER